MTQLASRFLGIALVLFFATACIKQHRSNKAGEKMQDFVVEISQYAKGLKPGFAIIPQNGEELLFHKLDNEGSLDERYISAIDGVGIEELFYNGSYAPDDYRLQMLIKARTRVPVLVADYLDNDTNVSQAFQYNTANGFLAFPRVSSNYDYQQIPATVYQENTNAIVHVSDAKNYLYLISSDGFADKQAFLSAIQQTNFDLVIIDAFYGDAWLTASEVAALQTKANGSPRLVIAYMSIGSAENYRYYWKSDWKLHHPHWLKKKYDGYPDEFWVKFWKKEWKDILYGNDDSYTKHIIDAGFDGAYLDNTEAYYSLFYKD